MGAFAGVSTPVLIFGQEIERRVASLVTMSAIF